MPGTVVQAWCNQGLVPVGGERNNMSLHLCTAGGTWFPNFPRCEGKWTLLVKYIGNTFSGITGEMKVNFIVIFKSLDNNCSTY